ncbi:unnamed protein product [Rotaria sordida]|uniref:Uncharacterized protein n=1 Tax=Rotaria sordida TaxID=392033 RepID=A0A814QCW3_9BILA|nr:unnamed protein product [Rotaria sordida]CAF1335084.1 unnamed protein product [Rotaria sordida]
MIVSGRLGREIVPSIHKLRQVISIYVYCMDKRSNEQWAGNFEKVKAIIVELDELISRIETDYRLQKTVEEPLSINIFTTDANASTSAMGTSTMGVNELVLFEIDADPTMATTKPFADISPFSQFPRESEILFMLGSIFRLKSIHRPGNSQLWIIRMILCSDNEHELKHVLMHIKQQYGSETVDLRTLGRLLSEMSKFDLAEKYFIRSLEQLPLNDPLLFELYQDLGKVTSQAGDFEKSMEWRRKAVALQQKSDLAGKQSY